MSNETYTQSTGMQDSFVKAMKLVVKDKAPLFQELAESTAVQKVHTWYYDSVAQPASNNAGVNAFVEGEATAAADLADMSEGVNYTQIVKRIYSVTGTQMATSYKAISDYLTYQKAKAMKSLALGIEYALINGTSAVGEATSARSMKGLVYFCGLANTADASSSVFSTTGESVFNDVLAALYADGGSPDTALCSPRNKRYIDNWSTSNTKYQDRSKQKLSNVIAVYESSFATIELMLHTMVADTHLPIFDKTALAIAYLRRPTSKVLPETSDAQPFQCIAEMTLEAKDPIGGLGWVKLTS